LHEATLFFSTIVIEHNLGTSILHQHRFKCCNKTEDKRMGWDKGIFHLTELNHQMKKE